MSTDSMEQRAYLRGFYKAASPRGPHAIAAGAGANRVADALTLYEQARAMARPTTADLEERGYNRDRMEAALGRIQEASEGARLNLSDAAPAYLPWWTVPAAVAGGALVGGGGGKSRTGAATGAAAGGLIAGGLAFRRARAREDVIRTARLLKDYGVLNADTLRRVKPLLT